MPKVIVAYLFVSTLFKLNIIPNIPKTELDAFFNKLYNFC